MVKGAVDFLDVHDWCQLNAVEKLAATNADAVLPKVPVIKDSGRDHVLIIHVTLIAVLLPVKFAHLSFAEDWESEGQRMTEGEKNGEEEEKKWWNFSHVIAEDRLETAYLSRWVSDIQRTGTPERLGPSPFGVW